MVETREGNEAVTVNRAVMSYNAHKKGQDD